MSVTRELWERGSLVTSDLNGFQGSPSFPIERTDRARAGRRVNFLKARSPAILARTARARAGRRVQLPVSSFTLPRKERRRKGRPRRPAEKRAWHHLLRHSRGDKNHQQAQKRLHPPLCPPREREQPQGMQEAAVRLALQTLQPVNMETATVMRRWRWGQARSGTARARARGCSGLERLRGARRRSCLGAHVSAPSGDRSSGEHTRGHAITR